MRRDASQMRKSKIWYLLVLCLLFVLVMVGCDKKPVVDSQSGNQVSNVQLQEKEQERIEKELENAEKNYYFYNGIFAGSFDGGNWYSPLKSSQNLKTRLWKYKEILSQTQYTAYALDGSKMVLTSLRGALGEGDGMFLPLEFKEYGTSSGDSEVVSFDLPVPLPPELAEKRADLERCYISTTGDTEVIVTNAKFDLKFARREENPQLPEKVSDYVKKYILASGLSEDLEFACASSHSCDINQDGKEEVIYNIESTYTETSPSEEMMEMQEKGHFMLVVLESEEGCQTILDAKVLPGTENTYLEIQRVNQMDVIDLENDGFYEICLIREGYESQTMEIYDEIENKCKLVCYNSYGA